ncbi:MAG: hypothetical protein HKN31_12760, partial [Pricia sp.]|nr:hypothetical protein [Pricia sp.]
MSKSLLTIFFLVLLSIVARGQEETPEGQEVDSLQTDLKQAGVVVVDTLKTKKVRINPLAPSKAAFYSAVFPGLGQIYN